jgi:hypothetical protein
MKSQLRPLVAAALYPTKAHTLPAVCERYGLEPGTGEEAYSSKTRAVATGTQPADAVGDANVERNADGAQVNALMRLAVYLLGNEIQHGRVALHLLLEQGHDLGPLLLVEVNAKLGARNAPFRSPRPWLFSAFGHGYLEKQSYALCTTRPDCQRLRRGQATC